MCVTHAIADGGGGGQDLRRQGKLRSFPSGAQAMAALAESKDPDALGCTQTTEILGQSALSLARSLARSETASGLSCRLVRERHLEDVGHASLACYAPDA